MTQVEMWMKKDMTIEVTPEMLDVDMGEDSVFEHSRYLALEYQCATLTMRGNRVLVSEDLAMTASFGKGFLVADVNVFVSIFHQDKYLEISHFFVESDIYGGEIDVDYVFSEYEKNVMKGASSFAKCRENLDYNHYLCPVILNFCSRVYTKSFLTSGDSLAINTMLVMMFGKYDIKTAKAILASAYRQLPHMKQELLTAYKTVYPLYI